MNPQPVSLADELRKLVEWIQERKANALRLAESKVGADKDGWLEDAEYYQRIEAALLAQHAVAEPQRVLTEHQRKVEEAAGMPIDWGMANASTVAHAAEQPKLTEERLRQLRASAIAAEFPDDVSAINWFHDAVISELKPLLLTSPVAPPPRHEPLIMRWRCPQCDYVNRMELTKCENCKSPLPLAPVAPGEQPPQASRTAVLAEEEATNCSICQREQLPAPEAQERASDEPKMKCSCQPIHSTECVFRDARSSQYRNFYRHETGAAQLSPQTPQKER